MLSYAYAGDCASQNSSVSHAKLALAWVYSIGELWPYTGNCAKSRGLTCTLSETTLVVHWNDYLFKNCPCSIMPDFFCLQFISFTRYGIVGNFCQCKISRKCLWTLWNKFLLFFFRGTNVTLWPHPYQLMATPHMQTKEMTKRRSMLVQQPSSLP